MASRTRIANIALSRIGVNKQLTNVDTDTAREATTIRTFIDDDINYVLRDFPWPWATSYATLALVAGSASARANNDWQFAYRYPSESVFVRRLVVAGNRNTPTPPPFRIGRDTQGRLIFTNEKIAEAEFTAIITNSEEFDSLFVSMLAWKLAAGAAPALSRIKDIARSAMEMYEIDKTKAQSRALNESQQEDALEAEVIRARD